MKKSQSAKPNRRDQRVTLEGSITVRLKLPKWYYRALAYSDRPPPQVRPCSEPAGTTLDLPEAVRRRITRKLKEVERLMRAGHGVQKRGRRA